MNCAPPTLVLYHMPGACSRISLVALEEIGVAYEDRGVQLMLGEQREPAYLAVNPKGKVPALVADGVVITESPAILEYLSSLRPGALLPALQGPAALGGLSDLIWCGGTLHPLVHRFFRPTAYTQEAPEGLKRTAAEQLAVIAKNVAARVRANGWWYGPRWSIVDTYVAWCFAVAAQFAFPLSAYPALEEHRRRVEAQASFTNMLERERAAIVRDELTVAPWYS